MIPLRHTGILLLLVMTVSCSTTRVLDEGEYLFVKNKVKIEAPEEVEVGTTEKAVKDYIDQRANKNFMGLFPVKLWLYNLPGDSVPESGLKHWIKYSLGEPPVLFRGGQVKATENRVENVLENRGFFHYQISPERRLKGRKLTMVYHVEVEEPYRIHQLDYPQPVDTLTRLIDNLQSGSLIVPGERYSLSVLTAERERILEDLKRRGFYYLLPDHLYFRLDTVTHSREINLRLALRKGIPDRARKVHYIDRIYIHHGTSGPIGEEPGDTLIREGIFHIHADRMNVKHRVLRRALLIRKGNRYDEQHYQRTLGRLSELGVYRFVNITYRETDQTDTSLLQTHIYLTDANRYRLQSEFQLVSKSNDFVGPGLRLSYLNRNLARDATSLRLDVNSGFETQLSRGRAGVNSLELGGSASFDVPRILAPAFIEQRFRNNPFIPRTKIRFGYTYFHRGDRFTVNSLNTSYGFRWKQTEVHTNDLKIFSLDYLRLSDVNPSLEGTSFLERYYNEQFILLARYDMTLNDLAIKRFTNHYLHLSIESAGNLASLADAAVNGRKGEAQNPSRLFGIPYAQYARVTGDYRLHLNLAANHKLVSRAFIGAGVPYGNSEFLPYKKQFYSGGTTSLRGFSSRSVGPGSYDWGAQRSVEEYYEQTGDLKLELNLEYRFGIYRFLKGALFVDAGNIWLVSENEDQPGGLFRFPDFLNQLAAGPGAGLRFDLSVLVLRLDVAFPVRKPYLPEGERWVFSEIDFSNPAWRKGNLVYNLAIGYPF